MIYKSLEYVRGFFVFKINYQSLCLNLLVLMSTSLGIQARTCMIQKLPLDLSTFRILREQGYIYVDKTKYAYDMIMEHRRFFLHAPVALGNLFLFQHSKKFLKVIKSYSKIYGLARATISGSSTQ